MEVVDLEVVLMAHQETLQYLMFVVRRVQINLPVQQVEVVEVTEIQMVNQEDLVVELQVVQSQDQVIQEDQETHLQ